MSARFTVHQGDVLDVLAGLPEGRFDGVLCDPPYGLEFMGKEWDAPWKRGDGINSTGDGFGEVVMADGAQRLKRPIHGTTTNPGCLNCGGSRRGKRTGPSARKRCRCSNPQFPHVRAIEGRAFQGWVEQWAAELLRVSKPGAPLLAFGGTRTYHRLAVAIEDAGAEISDSILAAAWVHSQGFPKSLDISKAIDREAGAEREVVGVAKGAGSGRTASLGLFRPEYDATAPATPEAARWSGYASALKPAFEPIVCAWKPREGTYAENAVRHGVAGWNIDGGRVASTPWSKRDGDSGAGFKAGKFMGAAGVGEPTQQGGERSSSGGRYPSNFLLVHHALCREVGTRKVRSDGHHPATRGKGGLGTAGHSGQDGLEERKPGTETVPSWECHPACPVAELDRQSGEAPAKAARAGAKGGNAGALGAFAGSTPEAAGEWPADPGGGASRFFFCAKSHSAERSAGLEWSQADWPGEAIGTHGRPRSRIADRWVECDNHHPTVKPLDLCRYLSTLILPPPREDGEPRRLLIPFSGSGSEAIGALLAGWDEVVCIENDPVSVAVSRCRIAWWEARIRETGASDPQTIIEWGRERPAPEARFRVSGPLFQETSA